MIDNPYGDNNEKKPTKAAQGSSADDLVAWIVPKLKHARDHREQRYGKRWKEYTRLWRGIFADEDKNTDSERSRVITPALQQAVDMTVSEMEEATFHRRAWFDIDDDIVDDNKEDAIHYRDQLLEDFELDNVPAEVGKVYLLGAVYGTGIGKLNVSEKEEESMMDGARNGKTRISVTLEAVRPDQSLVDPAALNPHDGLFFAHEMIKPLHSIKEKQRLGIYRKAHVEPFQGTRADTEGTGKNAAVRAQDEGVWLTEYYGKVPRKMVPNAPEDQGALVEALVTIVNEQTVLKVVANPFTMRDRPIVAYQHDTIPGEFYGRGVCEKGYNPQKALDAELRARIDALALLTAPMMGVDVTRMPRNIDTRVRPGKTIFSRGRPSEVFEQVGIGNPGILAHTFQHTGDLERMVQMGTGAMDSATPVGVNARNETASGISQLQAGFIKRSKRTMHNVERNFLGPLVRKALWRYMQFDPERYPVDMKFRVSASLGIMAKETEMSQLTHLLGYLPPESPAHSVFVQAIFENTASANKKELAEAIKLMNQPPDPAVAEMQQKLQQLEMQLKEAELSKEVAEAQHKQAQAELATSKAKRETILAELEDDKVDILATNAATAAEQARQNQQKLDIERRKVDAPSRA